jgi:hypothetical protein
MNDNDDDDFDQDDAALEDTPVYIVDEETAGMIAVACDSMLRLADAQLDEAAAENLQVIVDALAERFGLDSMEIVETQHGDEIIYSPKGGLFNDDDADAAAL